VTSPSLTTKLEDETLDILCAAYAYAEYFMCDAIIMQRITEVLQSHPRYWRTVCCELTKEHSELVGHYLLDCLLDAMYDPFILLPC